MAMIWAGGSPAADMQTDWSGGPGETGPLGNWETAFDTATGISWRAVPGVLALSSSGANSATAHLLASGYSGAFGVEAADLDGDGDVDIIGVAERSNRLAIWHNDGAHPPAFTNEILDSSFPAVGAVFAADLDGDQDLDIVASSGSRTGRVTCYLNSGGSPATWTAQDVETSWGETWEISAADVDDDGNVDIIGTSLSRDAVVWWRNDGQTPVTWTRQTVDSAFDGAHSARAHDMDGDGHTDIVGCGTLVDEVAWWRNGGDSPPTWTKHVIDSGFGGGRSVRIADIDNDGDPDVAAAGFGGGVQWWSNDGGDPLVWNPQVVDATLQMAHQLQIADLNGDGRLDLVAADYGGNSISWWENGGGGAPIAWTRWRPVYSLNRPLAVDVGDVDGDGALEIVGSSNSLGQFQWYDATTFAAEGTLTSSVLDRGVDAPSVITWTAATPPGTGVRFQLRGGADAGALGPWSADITEPGTQVAGIGRYLQYRVILATTDGSVSPLLADVNFGSAVAATAPQAVRTGLHAYPNPANPRAVIRFEMPRAGKARLDIFDTRGRRVRTLIDGTVSAGRTETAWNGTDEAGRSVATGVYHILLKTDAGVRRSRVTLVR
jgi:hypothetical protein